MADNEEKIMADNEEKIMADNKENINEPKKAKEIESKEKDEIISKKISTKSKWILPFAISILVLFGAFGVTKYVLLPISRKFQVKRQVAKIESEKSEENGIKKVGLIYDLKDLTVNTMGSNGYRFVIAEVAIETSSKKIIQELEKREPQLRDVFIKYLRAQTARDISIPSFQEKSKKELMSIINNRLNSGKVDSLYFVKLILQ